MLNSGDAIIVVALVIVAVVMLKGSRVEGLLLLKGGRVEGLKGQLPLKGC